MADQAIHDFLPIQRQPQVERGVRKIVPRPPLARAIHRGAPPVAPAAAGDRVPSAFVQIEQGPLRVTTEILDPAATKPTMLELAATLTGMSRSKPIPGDQREPAIPRSDWRDGRAEFRLTRLTVKTTRSPLTAASSPGVTMSACCALRPGARTATTRSITIGILAAVKQRSRGGSWIACQLSRHEGATFAVRIGREATHERRDVDR
jgi:hypothetical protein